MTENSFTPLPPGTTAWKLSLRFSCQAEYQLTGDVEPAELSEWIKVARTRRRWVLADSARQVAGRIQADAFNDAGEIKCFRNAVRPRHASTILWRSR